MVGRMARNSAVMQEGSVPGMPENLSVSAALEELMGHEAWAVIRLRESPTVTLVGGSLDRLERLADIPLEEGIPANGRRFDRLVAVPFRQVTERGFVAHDDGTALAVVDIETEREVPLEELIDALPDEEVAFEDQGGFDTSDEDYAQVVARIIRDEIGNGEGANLVVGRHYRAQLRDWNRDKALTVLRRLLTSERGAYWTFCFWTGDRFLIGASPERHVSVHGGDVRMNPISGTFRLRGVSTGSSEDDDLKTRLLAFLADEKEIFELFMVVDEELKMMCDICHEGGQVLGPFLKPMTHLVHTEYLLAGRTRSDVRAVLRDTMFAATVTGAPVENACRLIHEYESEGRGYYAGALALIGRDEAGAPTADSPIVIRTADVSPEGVMKVTAGATLVRDSNPEQEVAETQAKAGGILSAFGLVPRADRVPSELADLALDEDVLIALNSRNQRLAKFWLTDQSGAPPAPSLAGRTIAILHGEDDFVNMLAHVFSVLGMGSRVIRHEDYKEGVFDDVDLVVVGPGPGDPRELMRIPRSRPTARRSTTCSRPVRRSWPCASAIRCSAKRSVSRSTTRTSSSRARSPPWGSTVARSGSASTTPSSRASARAGCPDGVRAESDPATGDIHVVAGPTYRGVQFHAESILTENGFALLRQLLLELLGDALKQEVLVVDHYDSYTWNLVHLIAAVTGTLPEVVEHDTAGVLDLASRSTHVVLSPGPGHPSVAADFALGPAVFSLGIPVLGVCLGMQALVTAYGGTVARVDPAHGEVASVDHEGAGVLAGIPSPFDAVRYHSLAAVVVPDDLEVTAHGGRRGDGRPAPRAPARGRAVPSGVDPVAPRPRDRR